MTRGKTSRRRSRRKSELSPTEDGSPSTSRESSVTDIEREHALYSKDRPLKQKRKSGKSARESTLIDDMDEAEVVQKEVNNGTPPAKSSEPAVFHDETTPQEYLHYARQHQGLGFVPSPAQRTDLEQQIDKIDERLVAQLKLGEMREDLKNSAHTKCLRTPIDWALDKDPPFNTIKARQAYLQKKGVTKGVRRPTSLVAAAIRVLARESKLFFLCSKGKMNRKRGSGASVFFVWKSNGKLRMVLDGRVMNSFFDGSKAKFSLFTLETLKQVLDNLAAPGLRRDRDGSTSSAKWYAINVDQRHWFHQIRFAKKYQEYAAIPMTDRGNMKDDYFAFPRAVPMGWILAPVIAQCCTYSLLLAETPSRRLTESADLPIQFLESLKAKDGPPTWIPLNRGGGIFVLLDNILIATPVKEVADFWLKRLAQASVDYHAVYKLNDGKDFCVDDVDELHKKMAAECFFEMDSQRPDGPAFTFLGVDWKYDCHRVSVKEDRTDLSLPGLEPGTSNNFPKRCDVASIIGKLSWHRRVHRIRYHDESLASKAILKVYGIITPKTADGWTQPLKIEDDDIMKGLSEGWMRRLKQDWCKARPLLPRDPSNPLRITRVAVDAATKSQHAAYVIYPAALPPDWKQKLEWRRFECPDTMKGDIAIQELYAIYCLVRDAAEHSDLIVLATDSMEAKNWCEQGHGRNDDCLHYLRLIDKLLDEHSCRLYLTYVSTNINVSDLPSREDCQTLDESKAQSTLDVLKIAEHNAKGLWWKSGDSTGADKERVGEEFNK